MRKTLVAVALACAFPAVYAQSARSLSDFTPGTVVLYGVLDAGVEVLDAGNESITRIQGSGMSAGNRFGIRGSEPLGNGYSAIFTLEGRFSLDTGSVTYNESLYWCKNTGAPASTLPVCPGVRVVPGTAIAGLPPSNVNYQLVLGGLNLINNTLLQASRRSTAPVRSSTASRSSASSRRTALSWQAASTRRATKCCSSTPRCRMRRRCRSARAIRTRRSA